MFLMIGPEEGMQLAAAELASLPDDVRNSLVESVVKRQPILDKFLDKMAARMGDGGDTHAYCLSCGSPVVSDRCRCDGGKAELSEPDKRTGLALQELANMHAHAMVLCALFPDALGRFAVCWGHAIGEEALRRQAPPQGAQDEMARALAELRRIFGQAPRKPGARPESPKGGTEGSSGCGDPDCPNCGGRNGDTPPPDKG